jgi:hypothetical protein
MLLKFGEALQRTKTESNLAQARALSLRLTYPERTALKRTATRHRDGRRHGAPDQAYQSFGASGQTSPRAAGRH